MFGDYRRNNWSTSRINYALGIGTLLPREVCRPRKTAWGTGVGLLVLEEFHMLPVAASIDSMPAPGTFAMVVRNSPVSGPEAEAAGDLVA